MGLRPPYALTIGESSSVGLPCAARLRAAAAITASSEPLVICAYLTPVHEIISVLSPMAGRSTRSVHAQKMCTMS
jgi:hypothetical protein